MAVTDAAVVGITLLYADQITAEQAAGILDRLGPVSLEDLADVGG